MTKSEIVTGLIENGHAAELHELLLGVSTHNVPDALAETHSDYPSLHITRLVGAVRNHLDFISRYGLSATHIVDGQMHYFAYAEKFEQWLSEDAPGVSRLELEALAKACGLSDERS